MEEDRNPNNVSCAVFHVTSFGLGIGYRQSRCERVCNLTFVLYAQTPGTQETPEVWEFASWNSYSEIASGMHVQIGDRKTQTKQGTVSMSHSFNDT